MFGGSQEALGSRVYPAFNIKYTPEITNLWGNDQRDDCAIRGRSVVTRLASVLSLTLSSHRNKLCFCFLVETQTTSVSLSSNKGEKKDRGYCVVSVWSPPRTGKTFTMTSSTPADMVREFTFTLYHLHPFTFLRVMTQNVETVAVFNAATSGSINLPSQLICKGP